MIRTGTKIFLLALFSIIIYQEPGFTQVIDISGDNLIKYTAKWEGERFPDGRPRVPDDILERMKPVNIEEAWSVLRNEGYEYQFDRGWKHVHPGSQEAIENHLYEDITELWNSIHPEYATKYLLALEV